MAKTTKKTGTPKAKVAKKAKTPVSKASVKKTKVDEQHFLLHSGDKMPAVGFGCWKVKNEECPTVIFNAIKNGYRCIDEAADYSNEKEVGQGITRAIKEGVVKRKDLFITSKLFQTYHAKEHVRDACLMTLKDLNVKYLDLYLIHYPIPLKFVPFEERYPGGWREDNDPNKPMVVVPVSMQETWQAMEKLVKEGLVRNIGICNTPTLMIRDILCYAKVKPAVLQVELHPYLGQPKLLRFCQQHNIAVTAYSSFGAPSYTHNPKSHPGWPIAGFEAQKNENCLEDPVVKKIAKATGKTVGQVVLRWAVQRGTAVIPKTANKDRLTENRSLFGWSLSEDQMNAISALDQHRRFNDPGVFCEPSMGLFHPIYD